MCQAHLCYGVMLIVPVDHHCEYYIYLTVNPLWMWRKRPFSESSGGGGQRYRLLYFSLRPSLCFYSVQWLLTHKKSPCALFPPIQGLPNMKEALERWRQKDTHDTLRAFGIWVRIVNWSSSLAFGNKMPPTDSSPRQFTQSACHLLPYRHMQVSTCISRACCICVHVCVGAEKQKEAFTWRYSSKHIWKGFLTYKNMAQRSITWNSLTEQLRKSQSVDFF